MLLRIHIREAQTCLRWIIMIHWNFVLVQNGSNVKKQSYWNGTLQIEQSLPLKSRTKQKKIVFLTRHFCASLTTVTQYRKVTVTDYCDS